MSMSINLVDGSNILSPHLMNDVGTIRLVSILLFKEAQLSSFTKFF